MSAKKDLEIDIFKIISNKNVIILLFLCVYTLVNYYLYINFFLEAYHWIIFNWIVILAVAFVLAVRSIDQGIRKKVIELLKKNFLSILVIFIVSLFFRLLLIDSYPYVALGDEIREIGYNGLGFGNGSYKDFFAFGSYNGYGNFNSYFGYLFCLIFGNNPISFRLPSALLGVASIIIFYILIRAFYSNKIAFASALVMCFIPMHLHFSRTEFIINSATFFSLLIIIATILLAKYKTGYLFAGLIFGFGLISYVASRSILFVCVIFYLYYLLQELHYKKEWSHFRLVVSQNMLVLLGVLMVLGPTIALGTEMLAYSGGGNFFFKSTAISSVSILEQINHMYEVYVKSLAIIFYEKTGTNYKYPPADSILLFPLSIFFLIGFILQIFKKKNVLENYFCYYY